MQVCGKPVGVHISRGRSVDQLVEDQIADVQEDSDPDASVNKLLRLLRSHTDRKAATAAALKAVLTLPSRKVVPVEETLSVESSPPPVPEPIPDPESFLEGFLRCKHLVETFRANPSTHNKTPLAILHEYATRLGLEVCTFGAHLHLPISLVFALHPKGKLLLPSCIVSVMHTVSIWSDFHNCFFAVSRYSCCDVLSGLFICLCSWHTTRRQKAHWDPSMLKPS